MRRFSHDFLLGAATAAHQVEGNNRHSDCWAQEQMEHSDYAEASLDAVDHYHRYESDIRLMAAAGLNAYRFSIEWARIEPREGQFDPEALEHYRQVIACCRANGLEPVVTLHHFSSPVWLISKGSWEAETIPADFSRYVRYLMNGLGQELSWVCTINEANMGLQVAAVAKQIMQQLIAQTPKDNALQVGMNFEKLLASRRLGSEENRQVFGVETPQCFTTPRTPRGDALILEAHQAARAVIRELCPHIKVGLTLSLHDIQALPGGEAAARSKWEEEFTHYLPALAADDFLGVQNYTRSRYDASGSLPAPEGAELTQMNYEFYPEALEHVLRRVAAAFPGALLVTENGVATSDDTRRVEFLDRATRGVRRCIDDGLPVRGYFCWSLLDNFEWQKGFSMQFGLVAVDRATQTRFPKPSLAFLGRMRAD